VDHSSPVELESCTGAQQTCTAASAAAWTEPHPSLFAQLEQLLGEDSEPGPAFFIDSWTLGVAAASENFLRRRQDPKTTQMNREHAVPAFQFCSFPPFITMEEPPQNADLSPKDANLSTQDAELPSRSRELPPLAPATWPRTLPAARRLLGVTATSTRDEIKAAYRQMASLYHPDHLARRNDHERQFATDRMASINEAYRLLCEMRLA
jgi:hypothetical protein